METAQKEGNREIKRTIDHYNRSEGGRPFY